MSQAVDATAPLRETARPGASMDTEAFMSCVHCGLCLSACPTYLQLGKETDSPRGRIHLMRAVSEGRLQWTDEVVSHLDLCLECRACETACPSGVRYGRLLEMARADMAHFVRRPWRQRLVTGVLRDHVLPYPARLRWALAPARLLWRLGLGEIASRLLPGTLGRMFNLLPRQAETGDGLLPEVVPAEGSRRYRVGFLAGCVGSVLFSRANLATVRVLARNGCEVVIPRSQGCCGALHLHTGSPETARKFALANLEAFSDPGLDAIITNAAGCGSTLKEYGHLFSGDEIQGPRAQAFSAKVRDATEFLAEIGVTPPTGHLPRRVTYHDACHLAHGQGVRRQPRDLLGLIPGLELVPLPGSELCCGSAGLYNLLQPEMADRLLKEKVDAILSTGAEAVVTGNPGCAMQIERGLRERGAAIRVVHPLELLAESYGGWDT